MGFSRQEYWSGLPFPSPGDLPDPGIEPLSLASPGLQADALPQRHLESLCHYYGASSLWVGFYQWLVKVSWLGRLVLEFWWVELGFFSLECSGVISNGL